MTHQELLNILVGVGFTTLGWFCRQVWSAVDELKKDLAKLREDLPHEYITKYDYRNDIMELKNILVRIDTKLDNKADK